MYTGITCCFLSILIIATCLCTTSLQLLLMKLEVQVLNEKKCATLKTKGLLRWLIRARQVSKFVNLQLLLITCTLYTVLVLERFGCLIIYWETCLFERYKGHWQPLSLSCGEVWVFHSIWAFAPHKTTLISHGYLPLTQYKSTISSQFGVYIYTQENSFFLPSI